MGRQVIMTTLGVLAVVTVCVVGACLGIPFVEQCTPRKRDMIVVVTLLGLVCVVILSVVVLEALRLS